MPIETGYWSFKMDKDVDASATVWADIPAKNGGHCFRGVLATKPTSSNYLVRAWHNGKYDTSSRVYMQKGVFYPGRLPRVAAACALHFGTLQQQLRVHIASALQRSQRVLTAVTYISCSCCSPHPVQQ